MPNINPRAEKRSFTWPPTHITTSPKLFLRPLILNRMGSSTCYHIETGFVLTLLTGCGYIPSRKGHHLTSPGEDDFKGLYHVWGGSQLGKDLLSSTLRSLHMKFEFNLPRAVIVKICFV